MRVEVLRPKIKRHKPRVCAYCRVSTDEADQYKSFFTQIEHFGNLIKSNPEWEFAGVFADEAISGSGIEKRTDFQKMMAECRKGKIDRILTKSISRFARNTADMLEAVRELKRLSISVFFEKENIDTMKSEGELLLTVLSSFAQEELRNTAENIRWGLRRKFEEGRVLLDTNRFWGYDKDENGNLVINEEEAKIVRRIFDEYIGGKGCIQIANGLTADGIKTIQGKDRWHWGTILNMLKNEKFCGDALLQKKYCTDHMTKKMAPNRGHLPQYYIKNNHEPIISREVWEQAQALIPTRQAHYKNAATRGKDGIVRHDFTSKLKCAYCGKSLVHAKNCTGTPWEYHVWVCSNHRQGAARCPESRYFKAELLKSLFIEAYKQAYKRTADYSSELFKKNVEKAVIYSDTADFYFENGMKITVNAEMP